MNVLRIFFGVCLFVGAIAVGSAEEPQMPQPTAEHQALGMWVGSWSGEGEIKPGVFGPGGPMTWTEECSWFEGTKFHVVCTSETTTPMGPIKGLGIFGYNPGKQVHTHYGVDSNGWSAYSEGSRSGKTWTYQNEEIMGGQTYHTRATMTMTSPDTVAFKWEVSEDGETWTLLMEGTSTKE
jgi:hypothetical protein